METNAKIWRRFFIAVGMISAGISAATYIAIVSAPLAVPTYWAIIVGVAVFTGIACLAIYDGKINLSDNKDRQNYITVFNKYIGYPLDTGQYWLFPWFGWVRIRTIPKGRQTITITMSNVFYDCPTIVTVEAEIEITDPIEASFGNFGGGLERAKREIRYMLHSFFDAVFYLEVAAAMQKMFSLEVAATVNEWDIWHGLYWHHRYDKSGIESSFSGEFPSMEELKKSFESSNFFLNLKSYGIKPIALKFPEFSPMMAEFKKQQELAERRRLAEEQAERIRREKQIRAERAADEGKDVCMDCYAIEPYRCSCGACLACETSYGGMCYSCWSSAND